MTAPRIPRVTHRQRDAMEGRIYGMPLHDEPPDDEPMGSRILVAIGLVALLLGLMFAGPIAGAVLEWAGVIL